MQMAFTCVVSSELIQFAHALCLWVCDLWQSSKAQSGAQLEANMPSGGASRCAMAVVHWPADGAKEWHTVVATAGWERQQQPLLQHQGRLPKKQTGSSSSSNRCAQALCAVPWQHTGMQQQHGTSTIG
jgi:hypothetical protein